MGLTRKMASISSLGLIDYRSDKERIAKYTRQTRNVGRKALKQGQAAPVVSVTVQGGAPAPTVPPPSWQEDPTGRHQHRWWTGSAWSDQISDGGMTGSDPIQ